MARRWAVVPVRAPRLRSAGAAWRRIAEAPTSPDRARAARGAVLRREDCLTDRGRAALRGREFRSGAVAALVARDDRSTSAGAPAATRRSGRRQRLAPARRRESPLTPALSPEGGEGARRTFFLPRWGRGSAVRRGA